ncbi:MAG: ATP-binding protein [Pseudomonadota bacterium]
MIPRQKASVIRDLLDTAPAVAILGPRQVGKTTLALEIANRQPSLYLDLQSEADRVKLTDPGFYLRQHRDKLVVLDEIHRVPGLFAELRGIIDENRRAGRKAGQFLLLGSASVDLLRQSGESLAGRIAYAELFPLNASEVGQGELNTLWLRGGYPDSFQAATDRHSDQWRQDFIRTYLERDIPAFGPRVPVERLRRFWTMLAHLHGGLLNASHLARNLDVDSKTVATYLDLLVDLLLVRRLAPWHANIGKRLVKSPKVYLRDSGILHTLLQIPSLEPLLGHPKLGDSWEGFVIENIVSALPGLTQPYFYRTAVGAEIDLVFEMPDGLWAVEIKRAATPRLSKGFHIACEDLKPVRQIVVHGGAEAFRLAPDIDALPLNHLLEMVGSIADGRDIPR